MKTYGIELLRLYSSNLLVLQYANRVNYPNTLSRLGEESIISKQQGGLLKTHQGIWSTV